VLSPEHLQQLATAHQRARKIRRALAVAQFDGWTVAIFAGLTLLFGIFSPVGLLIGLAMAAVAFFEFRGAAQLRRLDLDAPKRLALNQLFFGSVLLAYAIYALWKVFYTHNPQLDQVTQSLRDAGVQLDLRQLERTIALLIYGALAAVAIFGQGGTALYYFTRRKHLESYLRDTPPWILQAQRAGLPI
jgi:hypothetical protein